MAKARPQVLRLPCEHQHHQQRRLRFDAQPHGKSKGAKNGSGEGRGEWVPCASRGRRGFPPPTPPAGMVGAGAVALRARVGSGCHGALRFSAPPPPRRMSEHGSEWGCTGQAQPHPWRPQPSPPPPPSPVKRALAVRGARAVGGGGCTWGQCVCARVRSAGALIACCAAHGAAPASSPLGSSSCGSTGPAAGKWG